MQHRAPPVACIACRALPIQALAPRRPTNCWPALTARPWSAPSVCCTEHCTRPRGRLPTGWELLLARIHGAGTRSVAVATLAIVMVNHANERSAAESSPRTLGQISCGSHWPALAARATQSSDPYKAPLLQQHRLNRSCPVPTACPPCRLLPAQPAPRPRKGICLEPQVPSQAAPGPECRCRTLARRGPGSAQHRCCLSGLCWQSRARTERGHRRPPSWERPTRSKSGALGVAPRPTGLCRPPRLSVARSPLRCTANSLGGKRHSACCTTCSGRGRIPT
mmetsp:Transcript_72578/g.200190  ORF Transcript_72578/g.200190 Transcript_72578/m.200190 type:complete len:279 (-) Transcript_72578:1836-2672(-)